jgi:hypothetical protein
MSFLKLTMEFFLIWHQHGSSIVADLCYVMDMYFCVLSYFKFWYKIFVIELLESYHMISDMFRIHCPLMDR